MLRPFFLSLLTGLFALSAVARETVPVNTAWIMCTEGNNALGVGAVVGVRTYPGACTLEIENGGTSVLSLPVTLGQGTLGAELQLLIARIGGIYLKASTLNNKRVSAVLGTYTGVNVGAACILGLECSFLRNEKGVAFRSIHLTSGIGGSLAFTAVKVRPVYDRDYRWNHVFKASR